MSERYENLWVNDDGLLVKFGRDKAKVGRGGEYNLGGPHRVVEIDVVWDDLKANDDSTDPTTVLDYGIRLPEAAFLEKAEFEVQVAFDSSGDSATLSFGLVDANDMEPAFTDFDADGIDQTIAENSIDAVGDTVTCDGALIGTKLGTDSGGYLVTAEQGTEDFTAGEGKLRIYYAVDLTGDQL